MAFTRLPWAELHERQAHFKPAHAKSGSDSGRCDHLTPDSSKRHTDSFQGVNCSRGAGVGRSALKYRPFDQQIESFMPYSFREIHRSVRCFLLLDEIEDNPRAVQVFAGNGMQWPQNCSVLM